MITGFDHAVVLVQNLEGAAVNAAKAGFLVQPGGMHDDGATSNAIIPFQDGTYLELIAFNSPVPPDGHYFKDRFGLGGGLADYALLTNDLEGDVRALFQLDLTYPAPVQLGRHHPDGDLVSWRMSLPRDDHPDAGLPFLIQDITPRERRVRLTTDNTHHPNGALGITGITVLIPRMNDAVSQFGHLLNWPAANTSDHFGSGRGLSVIPLPHDQGRWIALIQPVADSAPRRHFDHYGPGPYAVSIRTHPDQPSMPGDGIPISPELFDGARIYLQST
jgi:hypothetical protein